MNGDRQLEERLRRLSWPVDRGTGWAGIQAQADARTRGMRRLSAPPRWGGLRVAVFASMVVVLLAALAIGSLEAMRHLGERTLIVIISDQTTLTSPPGYAPGLSRPKVGGASERPSTVAAGQWSSLCVGTNGSLWAWGIEGNGRVE